VITKIYGAPGTGKTTWLLNKLEEEMQQVPLNRIAFVTHTVSAKQEVLERVNKFRISDSDLIYFKTIHGICFNQIGLSRMHVMGNDDYIQFADDIGIPFSTDFTYEKDIDGAPIGFDISMGNEFLAILQYASANLVEYIDVADRWPNWLSPTMMQYILDSYKKFKASNEKFDFIDMLNMYMNDCKPLDIDVLIVDEAQDLSKLQWNVVSKFGAKAKRIYLAGDDDQSIFSFLGADPIGFLHHNCDNNIVLPKTFRLKSKIWGFAQSIINSVHERQKKVIEINGTGGSINYWNIDPGYIDYDNSVSTMIIARHSKQLQRIKMDLEKRGVLFTYRGKSSVGKDRVKAFHDFMLLRSGGVIKYVDAAKIVKLSGNHSKVFMESARTDPERLLSSKELGIDVGVDPVSWMATNDSSARANGILSNIYQENGLNGLLEKPRIDLTTFHGCKGREANRVVLFTDCFRKAWDEQVFYPDEERRLSYVGVTRTIDELTIVLPKTTMYMRSLA
jgi:superfamily I DNA/RNA helicase